LLTGPQPKVAHQRIKFALDIFEICQKQEKSQILGILLTGPRDPLYGSVYTMHSSRLISTGTGNIVIHLFQNWRFKEKFKFFSNLHSKATATHQNPRVKSKIHQPSDTSKKAIRKKQNYAKCNEGKIMKSALFMMEQFFFISF
jgi:hypothetical protein